jgi:hypothetical protein
MARPLVELRQRPHSNRRPRRPKLGPIWFHRQMVFRKHLQRSQSRQRRRLVKPLLRRRGLVGHVLDPRLRSHKRLKVPARRPRYLRRLPHRPGPELRRRLLEQRSRIRGLHCQRTLPRDRRIAGQPGPQPYHGHAQQNLDWFMGAGLINSKNVITDGITEDNCKAGGAVFTYNQGVILGGLIEMNKLTDDEAHLDNAHRIAGGAIDYLSDEQGILREKEWPGEVDETGAQFKGIFVRKLAELHVASPRDRYANFLRANADGIWTNARAGNGTIGSKWQGPYDPASMATQSAALDCLVAAAKVS